MAAPRRLFACAVILSACVGLPQRLAAQSVSAPGPVDVIKNALQPLFDSVPHADANETSILSDDLKRVVDTYFSDQRNALNFDTDLLLGIQDFMGLKPIYNDLLIEYDHHKVKTTLQFERGSQHDVPRIVVVFSLEYRRSNGWKVTDIEYDGGISLREMIKHNIWCRKISRNDIEFGRCFPLWWK